MAESGYLTILPSLWTRQDPVTGRVVLTRKFIDGVHEYVKRWDGPVQVLLEPGDAGDNLDNIAIDPADLPFKLQILSYDPETLSPLLQKSAVVLLSAHCRQTPLAALCASLNVPAVYTTEYSLRTRLQILRTEHLNPLVHARRMLWQFQEERRQRRAFQQAAGIQANGTPTFEAYRPINPHAMLYFDTRVTRSMLAEESAVETRTAHLFAEGAPLRLAFSGRLIAMKGADHLVPMADHLRQLNVPFTLAICGAGALEEEMRKEVAARNLGQNVHFRGNLDFENELLPFIKNEVDLFVCCHRQGDPSCTYLETMSCGVPIAGYANEAFAGLVARSDTGWATPLNRPHLLARKIAELASRPAEIRAHSFLALDFARRHTFEETFAARVAHLRSLAHIVRKDEESSGEEAALSPLHR